MSEEAIESQPSENGSDDQQLRRRRRGLLRMYYGVDESATNQVQDDPLNIDRAEFTVDKYMGNVLKESSLNDLYKREERTKRDISELDSKMQYLVYENHSKFIKASETIREMKDDFQRLEDDMNRLNSRMAEISSASNSINGALADRKQQIMKFCGVHHLLKKLQFLFELPYRLKKCLEMGFYDQAVGTYIKAQKVLCQYQHMPSFNAIQQDCAVIVGELRAILKTTLDDPKSSTEAITKSVDLLLELGDPPSELCRHFLATAERQLEHSLLLLEAKELQYTTPSAVQMASAKQKEADGSQVDTEAQAGGAPAGGSESETQSSSVSGDVERQADTESHGEVEIRHMGIVEFVSELNTQFLANVSLVIQSCSDMFIKRQAASVHDEQKAAEVTQQTLTTFVQSIMTKCITMVKVKLQFAANQLSSAPLVKALDKLSGRLEAMDRLLPSAGLSSQSQILVKNITWMHTEYHRECLKKSFTDALMNVRAALVSTKSTAVLQSHSLNDLCGGLYATVRTTLEASLTNLKEFIRPTVGFSMRKDFRGEFCVAFVRAGIVMNVIDYILDEAMRYTESLGDHGTNSYPPTLILILSKLVYDMERSYIAYLVSYGDERFPPFEDESLMSSETSDILLHAKDVAKTLLNHYVRVHGTVISKMIRKSLETRDWLNTNEPRSVRSVMKRVVEEVTTIDKQVGMLYEEGMKKDQGSEGSKHTYTYSLSHSKGYPYSSRALDCNLLSNIQKLFYERIVAFGDVDYNKLSIVTGIIKIFLKALLECVRLRTFGKFGLQQMQVDAHYLQIYLWRFVSDEQLVKVLLDQVLSSTVERCAESVLMDQSVVEAICEKN
eukprot:Em0013g679a